MTENEKTLRRINALDGTETDEVPWLAAQLDAPEAIIRHAALFSLAHTFRLSRFIEKYWIMTESETDPNVMVLLIEVLGNYYRGKREWRLIERLQSAARRVDSHSSGLKESLEDAELYIMADFDTKEILRMTSADRLRELAQFAKPG